VWVEVAVINCATQTVVAMSMEAIPLFTDFCTSRKVRQTRLTSTNTFHSRGVENLSLFNEVKEMGPSYTKRCDYISSLTGSLKEELDNSTYWDELIRGQVNFQRACHAAYNYGARTFLEIGAHPVQTAIMAMNIEEVGSDPITCLPSLQKNQSDWTTLMTTFATLYTEGYPNNWYALYAKYPRNKVNTPFHGVELTQQLIGPSEIWMSENGVNLLNKKNVSAFITEEVKKVLQKSGRTVSFETISSKNFYDLGLSSLQIVLMKNQIQKILGENFILKFSDFLDCTSVAALTERICNKIEVTAKGLEHEMELADIARTKAQARKDMVLPKHIQRPEDTAISCRIKDVRTLLVTGATGNLAPFLIEWLLSRRNQKVTKLYCLVRGRDGLERIIKKFQFLDIDVTKLDMSKVSTSLCLPFICFTFLFQKTFFQNHKTNRWK